MKIPPFVRAIYCGALQFNTEERAEILWELQGQDRNLIQFAFWTGLRTSELVALDWSDIDWIRGVVVVTRALTQGMDEPEEGTKTDAGRLEVKLLPSGCMHSQRKRRLRFSEVPRFFKTHVPENDGLATSAYVREYGHLGFESPVFDIASRTRHATPTPQ